MRGGKEEQAEAFATSKCYQIARLCFLKEGAVRSKTFRASVDNFHDSPEGSQSLKLREELISMSLDVLEYFHRHDSMEIWNDVTCVIVVTPWEFGEVGSQKVLFVEYGKIEIVEGRRIIWSRQAKSPVNRRPCHCEESVGGALSSRCQVEWSEQCKRRGRPPL